MIVVVVSIGVVLMIIVGGFVSLTPNIYMLIEKNFMRRAYTNISYKCLQYGQLANRAKTLELEPGKDSKELDLGYMNKKDNVELDDVGCTIFIRPGGRIEVEMEYERKKPAAQ